VDGGLWSRPSRSPARKPMADHAAGRSLHRQVGNRGGVGVALIGGRTESDYRVCVAAPAYVGATSLTNATSALVRRMVGNHVAISSNGTDRTRPSSSALTDYIRGRKGYDYSHHGKADNPTSTSCPMRSSIDSVCSRGGSAPREVERTIELGVDQFSLYLMHDDPKHYQRLRRDVIGQV